MRVIVVKNMYPTEDDPSYGTFVRDQVAALMKSGVEIDVMYINGRSNKLNYFSGVFQMYKKLAHGNYDIIHAHYVFAGWVARMQWRLPLIVNFHGEPFGWHAWLSRKLVPYIDGCIVTSASHKEKLGFANARVVPCGIDISLFTPMPQAEAREQLGWDADRKVMIFVGADRPEKRLDLIRAAYDILQTRHDKLDFAFPHGLSHEEIPVYMNASDVLVLASDYEGSPMVIKEAMACNLPIVSTAVGDVPEVVNGVEGCYICEQDPEDIAAKVELALKFGKRTSGRDSVGHLQLNNEAEKILALYNDVLAKTTGCGNC